MQPEIALSLCVLLIAVLLIMDGRRKDAGCVAIWLPTIWVMYCGSRPLAYWFDPELVASEQIDYTEGSAVDRTFLIALIIVGLAVLLTRRVSWAGILRSNTPLFLLFGYMAFSILWSDYPAVSSKRWVRTSGDLIMVLLVLTQANPLEAIRTVFRRSAFVLLPLSMVLIKYFRSIGVEYSADGSQTMWIGVTSQKNDLGYVAMVCGLYFVSNILTNRKKGEVAQVLIDVVFLVLSLWLLAGSSSASSKTSWIGLWLGLCVVTMLRLPAARFGIGLSVFFFAITYLALYGSVLDSAVSAVGRDATLTGRTDIWEAVLQIGPRNPLVGRGYGSFWIGNLANDLWSKSNIYVPLKQSHNGYIDIYIELGALGLILLACLTWSAFRNMRQTLVTNPAYGVLRTMFFAVLLVHNVTESSFARPTHLLWFLFLLVSTNVRSVALHAPTSDGQSDRSDANPAAARVSWVGRFSR